MVVKLARKKAQNVFCPPPTQRVMTQMQDVKQMSHSPFKVSFLIEAFEF